MRSNPDLERLIRERGAKVSTTQVDGFTTPPAIPAPPPVVATPTAIKASKYGNVRTEYRGIRFDSKAEATRAAQLDMLQAGGEVTFWLTQVKFRLGCPENVYVVDFLVFSQGECHAEDVKAIETEKFRRDRKLWASYGPVPLWIIKKGETEVIHPHRTPQP